MILKLFGTYSQEKLNKMTERLAEIVSLEMKQINRDENRHDSKQSYAATTQKILQLENSKLN